MSVNSATVSAGDIITAAGRNAVRLDILTEAGDTLTDSGSANAIVITCDNQVTSLVAGQVAKFIPAAAPTGATTVRFKNSLSLDETDNLKRADGSAIRRNDFNAKMITIVFDGTDWILQSGLNPRSYLLDVLNTPVTVANTTTKTAIYSTTIPANELGTENLAKIQLWLNDIDVEASANDDLTITVELGGTIVGTVRLLDGSSATTDWNAFLELRVTGNGATNVQKITFLADVDNNSGAGAYSGQDQFDTSNIGTTTGKSHYRFWQTNAGAKDSTTDLTLIVYAQWGDTGAGNSITAQHGEGIMYKK